MPDRILILTQKEIGDLIVMTPLLRALKRNFPGHELWIGSRPVAREVYAQNPAVSGFLDIQLGHVKRGFFLRRIAAFFRYAMTIRHLRPALVLQLEANDVMALWTRFSGAKIRIGILKQTFKSLFTAHNPLEEGMQSALLFYLGFLIPLRGSPDGFQTELFVAPKVKPRPHVATVFIHPGARLSERLWPAEKWVELIRLIRKKYPRIQIRIAQSSFDAAICGALLRTVPAAWKCEWFPVEAFSDLTAAVMGVKLALTLDSAPRHVAAAYGIPTVSLFAHWIINDWRIYDAKKHGVVLSDTPRPDYGIATISVADVFREFEKHWRRIKK